MYLIRGIPVLSQTKRKRLVLEAHLDMQEEEDSNPVTKKQGKN